jgi:hypothetical protein
MSPAFFERLIVDLLIAMGYGGGRAEMGQAIGRSGDARTHDCSSRAAPFAAQPDQPAT